MGAVNKDLGNPFQNKGNTARSRRLSCVRRSGGVGHSAEPAEVAP